MTTTQDRQIAHRLIKLQLNPMVMMGSPFNLTMLNWGALLANHSDDEVAVACPSVQRRIRCTTSSKPTCRLSKKQPGHNAPDKIRVSV